MATTRIQIGPVNHGRRMTLEEFREAEEESGHLYELARGVLEVTEIPGDDHFQIVHNLHESISRYHTQHPGLILRIGHGSDVRYISPELESDRHPDVAIVFHGAPRDSRGRLAAGLAVEVVSTGKAARDRDFVAKREEYLAFGVREYWIVDPRFRQVTVLIRRDGAAGPTWDERIFADNEVIGTESLPGFAGTVAALWLAVEAED